MTTATAGERYAAAVAASNLGRMAVARRGLAAAARLATDPDLAARIAGTTAYLDAETGDAQAALARCRDAAARPGLSRHTRAVLVGQVGLIEMRRGDADGAKAHLGWAMSRLGRDPAAFGRLALNRGDVHLQCGDLARAAADFRAARDAFARAGLPVDEAKARHNEGYTALLTGDLIPALAAMAEARPRLAAASPVLAATADVDRAEVLLAAGMPEEATALLTAAARTAGARSLRRQQAEAELLLARTLRHTDPAAAARTARAAATRFHAQGNEPWRLRAEACALLADEAAGRRIEPELLEARAGPLAAAGARDDARRLRLTAARLRLRRGEPADVLRRAAPGRHAPVPTRLLAREARVELELRRGRRGAALRAAGAGLDELAAAQAALGSIDLQTSLVLHARPLLRAGTDLAVRSGTAGTAYAWSERARALAARMPPLTPPDDPELAAALAEVRRIRALGSGADDARREAELVRRIEDAGWRRRGAAAAAPIAPLGDVQAHLGAAGAVGVAWLWTGERTDAVVLSTSGARLVPLGPCDPVVALLGGLRADLDATAARLPAALAATVRAALAERLAALDRLLVRPLGLIADVPVVLSVPGALGALPWPMLPSLRSRPVTVATSFTRWAGLPPQAPPGTAGFAAGPGVARAEEEVERAAEHWPAASVLTGDGAGCAAVSALASTADVLHVSAHGRYAPEQPLLSALELADGPWFGHEVQRLPRVPALVVLSACEVGRSGVRWGQETTGLARAWLEAGARSVIASAADVADDTACEALAALHAHLAAGRPAAEALALAAPGTPFVCAGG